MAETKLYTLEELSSMLHVTKRTLYEWLKSGKLTGCKTGKRWLVTQKQLDEFLSRISTDSEEA